MAEEEEAEAEVAAEEVSEEGEECEMKDHLIQ